jgi:hypothetical protein
VARVYTGQRVLSALSGTIQSCDGSGLETITGNVTGPASGNQAQLDARIFGCLRVDSSAASGFSACDPGTAAFLDTTKQTESIKSGTFVIKRVDPSTTCDQVRALTYP